MLVVSGSVTVMILVLAGGANVFKVCQLPPAKTSIDCTVLVSPTTGVKVNSKMPAEIAPGGIEVIAGGGGTVTPRGAGELVMEPAEFETITE